jgi:hypothetical protein
MTSRVAGLASYIEDQIRADELTDWTVFMPTGDQTEVRLGGRTFQSIKRTPRADRSTTTRFIVRSILNPPDEAIDLSAEEFTEALRETNDERRLEGYAETKRPAGPSIRLVRGQRPQNGLLLVYPLDPIIAEVDSTRPLVGIMISFPESSTALQRLYLENTVSRRKNQN